MVRSERIVDLKKEEEFIEAYVSLRNRYRDLLVTKAANITETKKWLTSNEIEIRALVQDNVLLGVVILYLNRDGEIAFFAENQNVGIGSKLLRIIFEVAEKRNLKSIWGWVLKDNFIAQRVFEKNGFIKEGLIEKKYERSTKQGVKYRRILSATLNYCDDK